MIGSVNLGMGSVPTAGDNPTGGSGSGDVDSVTATVPAVVDNTDPANPIINVAAAAPPAIGPASVGTSSDVARGNHTHPTIEVANAAALIALVSGAMNAGTFAYVTTLKSWFRLEPSALTAVPLVRVAASGKAGHQWIRTSESPAWWGQTAWQIDPTNGNDEAVGGVGTPIKTFQEFERRRRNRKLPLAETYNTTVSLLGDVPDTDFVYDWGGGRRPNSSNALTITGTMTVLLASGAITAATAINRVTAGGNRNTITRAGIGAFVGHLVRLTATPTTTAWIMRAVNANEVELSEQSVNGVLGAGFTNGENIEVVQGSKLPGAYFGISNNLVTFVDCNLDPGIGLQITSDTAVLGASFAFTRCRIRGTTTNQFTGGVLTYTACGFVDRQSNCRGLSSFNLCAQINQATAGIQISHTIGAECTSTSHMSEASSMTLNEGTYFHVSGGGAGAGPGVFNLAAAQKYFAVLNTAHLSCGAMWGAGNNATSIAIDLLHGSFSFGANAPGAGNFVLAGGVGLRMYPIGNAQDVPLTQLPHAIANGQQPGNLINFSGQLETDTIASLNYMANPGDAIAAQPLGPQRYATSERLFLRLRVTTLMGPIPLTATVTLFKNGVATTMQVTIPINQAQFTKLVDSAHPILFTDGDDFDLRIDHAGAVGTGTFLLSAALEPCT